MLFVLYGRLGFSLYLGRIKRFFFHIAYNGINYHGWQRQLDALGVQEVIENVLGKIVHSKVVINGCGRTDAQVHASQYFFHVDLEASYNFDLLQRLNQALPPDIAVFAILPVADHAHARFDATQRTYDYFLHTRKDPFLQNSSAFYADRMLDLQSMRAAVALLPQYDDYYGFCKSPASFTHTICHVGSAHLWTDESRERLRFQISANRFLTGMIRILMGRLLEIGAGQMSLATFEGHLRDKKTPKLIRPAYPQGLYLSKIVYPYLDLPQRTDFAAVFQNTPSEYWREI
ncbi:MAG: tRNA pseudouridine(38-40) synthase TruA [Saprospiraceae bacterium]|nr:tRNA pseudouridine(38-40) synthase TruA [Saprospiraceae bacterium]